MAQVANGDCLAAVGEQGTPVRSAPTAKMNGLPVTQIAATPDMARASSIAFLNSSSPPGPKVFGLVVETVVNVMTAAVPAPNGEIDGAVWRG